jgi:hypothetical protein
MILDVNQLLDQMSWQRLQILTFSQVIPANTQNSQVVQISDDGHFHCKYLGGQFTTLTGAAADGGACTTSIKISDNGRRWDIMDNLIPMSLFCNPGRQRVSGVAGDPSNPMFYPVDFDYTFLAGTTIRIEFANSAAFANTIWLAFYGEKLFKGSGAPAAV